MNKLKILMLLCIVAAFTACSDNDDSEQTTAELTIRMILPDDAQGEIRNAQVGITNVNTAVEVLQKADLDGENTTKCLVEKNNLYTISVSANLATENNGNEEIIRLQGKKENIVVTSDKMEIEIELFPLPTEQPTDDDNPHKGFVLAEIFCAGTANPQGNYYYADKYFVIYNNTDHTLYADSLLLLESDFLTTMKQDYRPDIMDEYFAVGAMYMIPGSGHDHPVAPGGKLLIVDNALDHTYANPNSWDLSHADFEWYDETTDPRYTDVDNPDVPNLKRIYCYTRTLWSPHTQGFRSYAIATMKTNENDFLDNYYYDYEYHLVGLTGEAEMTGTCYKVPNEWIIDAVNMSTNRDYQWTVTSPALDQGFTFCSEFNFDDSRFGKSVRRKTTGRDGNRAILQDTNNSSVDFIPRADANPFFVF